MILSEFETFMLDSRRIQPRVLYIFICLRPTLPKYAEQILLIIHIYWRNIKSLNVLIHFTDCEQIHNFHMLIYFKMYFVMNND